MNQNKEITLSVFPNAIGMGFVICENPQELIDYGIFKIKPLNKKEYMDKLGYYLYYYNPSTLLIRDHAIENKKVTPQTRRFIQDMITFAQSKKIAVHQYSRKDIKSTFKPFGDSNKDGINRTLASWYPEIKSRLPKKRRNFDAEHYQSGMFDAFALMITYFDNTP